MEVTSATGHMEHSTALFVNTFSCTTSSTGTLSLARESYECTGTRRCNRYSYRISVPGTGYRYGTRHGRSGAPGLT